jgi:3-carboxy-cis,cis-muconate cycloisomerase
MTSSAFERFLVPWRCVEAFGAHAVVQHMLDFEAALAKAQAAEGLIPASAANAIAAACRAELHDAPALVDAASRAGSLAIPLIRSLTSRVAKDDAKAADWVHFGSTSQDAIDTAMVLSTREALAWLDAAAGQLATHLLALADTHLDAPVLARTLMQPAQVTSFGLKCTDWAAPLVRSLAGVRAAAARALALQLGGAIGTLSGLGVHGPAVARRMADELRLALPPASWHTQRDEWLRLALEVAVLAGNLSKIATDLALMAQGEVGELAEPSVGSDGKRRGGSSAMPHKRNPVSAMVALACTRRVPQRAAAMLASMAQEHERGLGNWQAELAEWPELLGATSSAAQALAEAFAGLQVDRTRMRRNIDAQQGLVFAEAATALVARAIGKAGASALIEQLAARTAGEARSLHALLADAVHADVRLRDAIDEEALREVFDADAAARPAGALAASRLATLREALAALPVAPWTPH